MFDKLKGISKNVNVEKLKEAAKSLNTDEIKDKMSSAMDSLKENINSAKAKTPTSTNDSLGMGNFVEGMMEKSTSKIQSFSDTMVEKTMEYSDPDNLKEMAKNSDNKYIASSTTFMEGMCNGESVEDVFASSKEVYQDRKEKEVAKEQSKPKDNKKKYKNLAKGAMFVGSFLYTQKYEGADSGSAFMHALNKTKDVDDYFEGRENNDSDKVSNNDMKQNSAQEIKSIVHYEYICPKNNRGHNINVPNIDVPTIHSNGCPERKEAIEAIMKATGVSESQASAIWNGGSNLHWRKVSYTYVNNGQLGGTVKC